MVHVSKAMAVYDSYKPKNRGLRLIRLIRNRGELYGAAAIRERRRIKPPAAIIERAIGHVLFILTRRFDLGRQIVEYEFLPLHIHHRDGVVEAARHIPHHDKT